MKSEYERQKNRVEGMQFYLEQERERKKKKPNVKMEEATPDRLSRFDFWCRDCEEDFEAPCVKTKHRLEGDMIAVWRAMCPDCGTDCIRHITHKDEDMYYYRSTKIRHQRNEYAEDLLQAGEFGFKTRYGEPYEEFMRKMQGREEELIMEEKKIGLKGRSFSTQQKLRELRGR